MLEFVIVLRTPEKGVFASQTRKVALARPASNVVGVSCIYSEDLLGGTYVFASYIVIVMTLIVMERPRYL